MIEIYLDSARTNTLLSTKGVIRSTPSRRDDYKGDEYRTADGTLINWSAYQKYEENITLIDVPETDKDTIEELIADHTRVYYCPDVDNRNDELYNVLIPPPMTASYNSLTKLYEISIRIREV